MPDAPKVVTQTIKDVTVVDILEARLIDGPSIEAIGEELFKLVDRMNCRKLVLDFTKVQFLSSAALSVLMELRKKSAAIKGAFVLCGLSPDLMKVFEITKLNKLLQFAPDEDQAVAMLG